MSTALTMSQTCTHGASNGTSRQSGTDNARHAQKHEGKLPHATAVQLQILEASLAGPHFLDPHHASTCLRLAVSHHQGYKDTGLVVVCQRVQPPKADREPAGAKTARSILVSDHTKSHQDVWAGRCEHHQQQSFEGAHWQTRTHLDSFLRRCRRDETISSTWAYRSATVRETLTWYWVDIFCNVAAAC